MRHLSTPPTVLIRLRRLVALVALAFCALPACVARESAPAAVALPPPTVTTVATRASTPCTIVGDGELVENDWDQPPEFGLYADATPKDDPELWIRETKRVGVTWSNLPPAHAPNASPLASVTLGGEGRISVHAFAKLAGRHFQLRTTGEVLGERMWIDRGYPVEILGMRDSLVVVRRATGFASPASFEASIACGMMAYDPVAIDPPPDEEPSDVVSPVGQRIELHRFPGAETFLALDPGDQGIAFGVKETKDDWLHVRWHENGLGIDGWVKKSDVEEGARGIGGFGAIGSSGGSARPLRVVRVKHSTPLFVGDDRHRFADATFDPGAILEVWSVEGDWLAVSFEDRVIEANDGFWISNKAVEDH